MKPEICRNCAAECGGEIACAAYEELSRMYRQLKVEDHTELMKNLRSKLNITDAEVADDLRELGERIIAALPELSIIPELDVQIGYVRSYERKTDKGKTVCADCRKVNKTYGAYLPFDFVITFYEPNMYYMTENQQKILMLHELKHIGIGDRGLRIEYHDVEDFGDILMRFGIDWNWQNRDVPDVLNIK